MNIVVIGIGYWGPNLVRNFSSHKEIKNVYVFDKSSERLQFIKQNFPNIHLINNYEEIFKNVEIDCAAIATPVETHYSLAKDLLNAGKNLWIEKAFTATSEQGEDLIKIAKEKKLKIFVDHTFIYNGAVRKIKEIINSGELGEIIFFDSVRINVGLIKHDINVLWDLAPHDLSIMDYILQNNITSISANGIANYYGLENIAHLSLYFNNNCFSHIHVNWTSPVKIRSTLIGGTKKMLIYNDMENFEKIKVYDSSVEVTSKEGLYQTLVQYRTGDIYSPKINNTEALTVATEEFVRCVKDNREPLTGGKEGLKVVKILEFAEKSIKQKGKLIEFY